MNTIDRLKAASAIKNSVTLTPDEAEALLRAIDVTKFESVARLKDELIKARETNTKLNARCQKAESALAQNQVWQNAYERAKASYEERGEAKANRELVLAMQKQGRRLAAARARVDELRTIIAKVIQ